MMLHHFSTALRSIARTRWVTAINVTGLGLGLACFIGAQAVVEWIESSDRQFATADRAYVIAQRSYSVERGFDTGVRPETSPAVGPHLRQDLPGLEAVARVDKFFDLDFAAGPNKALLAGMTAERDFLEIFPFEMLPGAQPEPLSAPRSAVLTKKAALALFGTEHAVGKSLRLKNAIDLTVTGVIAAIPSPSQFEDSPLGFRSFDVLLSWDVLDEMLILSTGQRASIQPATVQWAQLSGPTYVLLPKSGAVTEGSLRNELARFVRHVPKERREVSTFEFTAIPASKVWSASIDAALFKNSGLSVTRLLQILGTLVLAIACLNYSNLAAAMLTTRVKENGMRRVLGASRPQLIALSIAEVIVMTAGALALSLVLLAALAPMVRSAAGIDSLAAITTSARLWAQIGAAVVAAGALAAMYPAIMLAKSRVAGILRQKSTGHSASGARVLVAIQFAAASFLILAVIVVFAQTRALREKGLGSSAAQTLLVTNRVTGADVNFDTLSVELERVPGVERVAAIDLLPWSTSSVSVPLTRDPDPTARVQMPYVHTVTPGFAQTLGLTMVAGRGFDANRKDEFLAQRIPGGLRQAQPNRIYATVIDEPLAHSLGWSNPHDAIDQIVHMPFKRIGLPDIRMRIVGVVEERPLRIFANESSVTANMYVAAEEVTGFPLIRLRTGNVAETLRGIEHVWDRFLPTVQLQQRFLDEQFDRSYALFDRISWIVTAVAVLALIISVMGLFGMAVFVAGRRRHEIGVRKTIGATASQILAMLLKDFSKPIVIANLAIWPIGYLAANAYLGVFSHRIALTPVPFLATLLAAVLIAWLAVGGQAWRAARVKPVEVLRYE